MSVSSSLILLACIAAAWSLPMLCIAIEAYDFLGLAYCVAATLTVVALEWVLRPDLRSR